MVATGESVSLTSFLALGEEESAAKFGKGRGGEAAGKKKRKKLTLKKILDGSGLDQAPPEKANCTRGAPLPFPPLVSFPRAPLFRDRRRLDSPSH